MTKELEIDGPEIERRKAYVDLRSEDLKNILQIKGVVSRHTEDFARGFFDRLERFPEAKGLFSAPTALAEARRLKKEHLLAMVAGEYGERYVEERLRLGRIYSKYGLDPKVFLGSFQSLVGDIGARVMQESPDPKAAFAGLLSLGKVASFDLGIIVDVIVADRERTIRQQQEAIRELSTPVLQMRDRLLILPIVGMIDTYRARLLTENLLKAIRTHRAKVVVIDITGVAAVDSKVANHLVQTVTASRLMGAQVIVTGLSAEIAQTLVTLGAELSKLNTVGDLQGGIEEAERVLGLTVVAKSARTASPA